MEDQNQGSWQYKPDSSGGAQTPVSPAQTASEPTKSPSPAAKDSVSWTASEYIDHTHGASWYAVLLLATVGIAATIYFLTKDYFASGVTVVVGAIVGVFASRKPRQITYEISSSGIKVGEKMYSFSQFKSFTVLREGILTSVNLMPLKKFMPPISAYFEPKDEERITNALGNYLPYEERKMDSVDRLTRRLRL